MTEDWTPRGWAPGGPALYAARMASGLGCHVTLITQIPRGFARETLDGLAVVERQVTTATRFENRYGPDGRRLQVLHHPGSDIPESLFRTVDRQPDVLFLAPAYHEVATVPATDASVVAVALQGPFRAVDTRRHVVPTAQPVDAATPFNRPGVSLFFSEEDALDADCVAMTLSRSGSVVALTRGARGASVFLGGERQDYPPYPAVAVDPTGAGDCFATAYVVRLAETGDRLEATRYALAAGAVATECVGVTRTPVRSEIEARIRAGMAA